MKRLFHYSKACHLNSICSEGVIRLATAGVIYDRPAAWFSTREDYEPTACIGRFVRGQLKPMSRDEMAAIPPFNPVRIEVKPEFCPFDWEAFKQLSGISPKLARALEIIARQQKANPKDWYASFVPIGVESWLAISYYFKGAWREVSADAETINKLAAIPIGDLRSAMTVD